MGRAALEVGGWVRPRADRLGATGVELRHELIELAASLGLASVAELLTEAP